jgi:hypothetical protein
MKREYPLTPIDDNLRKVYEESDYVVDDDPPLVMKIGEQNDGLRILFASFNVESAAFITAWNPSSQKLSLDENYDRQADLLVEIEKLRLNYFVGRGEHPDQSWYEESYLVLGITKDQADALAKQFEQNAYLFIAMSGVPELVETQA